MSSLQRYYIKGIKIMIKNTHYLPWYLRVTFLQKLCPLNLLCNLIEHSAGERCWVKALGTQIFHLSTDNEHHRQFTIKVVISFSTFYGEKNLQPVMRKLTFLPWEIWVEHFLNFTDKNWGRKQRIGNTEFLALILIYIKAHFLPLSECKRAFKSK